MSRESIIRAFNIGDERLIAVANGADNAIIELGVYNSFVLIIPSAMNSIGGTFEVYDVVAGAWITTGVTATLATGFYQPSVADMAKLQPLDKFRLKLASAVGAACVLQFFAKG